MKNIASLIITVTFLFSCTSDDLTTEENLAARCAQAASALQSCIGAVPEGFVEACETDADEESFELIDQLVYAECTDTADGKSDGLFETAFAAQCAPVVGAALVVTEARSGGYTRLSSGDRRTLRNFFGDIVDDVRFYFNAKIVDEWDLGFTNVQFAFDVAAQTFGDKVFIDDRYRPGDEDQLALLAHEMQHVRQARSAGGFFPGFAYDYCKGFWNSDFDYRSHEMEREARRTANYFKNR
jgi:hypothetical protein